MYSVYYDVRRNNRIFVPEKLTKNLDTLFERFCVPLTLSAFCQGRSVGRCYVVDRTIKMK